MYRQRLTKAYGDLSPGYRRIADYLLKNYQDAAFMTAGQIARAANVNTAQVVRLAQRLGFAGFPELIASVREQVKQELRAIYQPKPEDQSPAAIFRRTLIQDHNNLEHMLRHFEDDTIETIVEILATAPRVFVTAAGNYSQFARAFAVRLARLGRFANTIANEFVEQAICAAVIRPGDALVAIGMTSLTPTVATMVKLASRGGAHTIGIVGALNAPVASAADYVIHAPADTEGLVPSWTALAATTHGLTQAVAERIGEPATDWFMHADYLLHHYLDILNGQMPPMREALADWNPSDESASTNGDEQGEI